MSDRQKKYEEFKIAYEKSGMTQKSFSELRGISPSMVSYYLSKARNACGSEIQSLNVVTDFQKLELVDTPPQESQGVLQLDLPRGITLTLRF